MRPSFVAGSKIPGREVVDWAAGRKESLERCFRPSPFVRSLVFALYVNSNALAIRWGVPFVISEEIVGVPDWVRRRGGRSG